MSSCVHGILSIVLIGVAVAVAAIVLFVRSIELGAGYLGLSVAGMLCIVYDFCAKCPCKMRCGHVLPGLIARLFPRPPGSYAGWELALAMLGLVLIVVLPLFWLWQNVATLIVFAALNALRCGRLHALSAGRAITVIAPQNSSEEMNDRNPHHVCTWDEHADCADCELQARLACKWNGKILRAFWATFLPPLALFLVGGIAVYDGFPSHYGLLFHPIGYRRLWGSVFGGE